MSKEIEFPILPHLKKYIYKFYRLEVSTPVKVTMHSSLGIAMKHVLREKKKANKKDLDRYAERMLFILPSDMCTLEIRSSFVVNFNVHYDRIFKEQMRQWVQAQWEAGINNRVALQNFLAYYNIKDHEYSYDNAQRDWLRFKNKEYDSVNN